VHVTVCVRECVLWWRCSFSRLEQHCNLFFELPSNTQGNLPFRLSTFVFRSQGTLEHQSSPRAGAHFQTVTFLPSSSPLFPPGPHNNALSLYPLTFSPRLSHHHPHRTRRFTSPRYKPVGDMSAEDPLHLVIKADTQEQLDDCIRKINALMGQQHIKVRGK